MGNDMTDFNVEGDEERDRAAGLLRRVRDDIDNALVSLTEAEMRGVRSRELALVRTKLQEALFWKLEQERLAADACSKCGSADVSVEYHPAGPSCRWGSHSVMRTEHLHWSCRRCRFDWCSAPRS